MAQDPRGTGPPVTDPPIADLVARYVAQCRSNVVRLLIRLGHYFEEDDFAAVATLGRDLAGSGESFGLPRVSALGRSIVAAAEAANGTAMMQHVQELQSYLDSLTPAGPGTTAEETVSPGGHPSSLDSERKP